MNISNQEAAEIFSQLGNETRLCIIKILVEAGDSGLKVGQIQKELGTPGSTLSHHLLHLRNCGLIKQTRIGNALVCSVNYAKLNQATDYLNSECCIRVENST
ncbi:MAG: ArsR/SmtB family transcription factor [Arenicella sp.]